MSHLSPHAFGKLKRIVHFSLKRKFFSDGLVWSLTKMCKGHSVTMKIGFSAKVQMVGCCVKMVGFVPSLRQYLVSLVVS